MVGFRGAVELGPLDIARLTLMTNIECFVGFAIVFCDDNLRDNVRVFQSIGIQICVGTLSVQINHVEYSYDSQKYTLE